MRLLRKLRRVPLVDWVNGALLFVLLYLFLVLTEGFS